MELEKSSLRPSKNGTLDQPSLYEYLVMSLGLTETLVGSCTRLLWQLCQSPSNSISLQQWMNPSRKTPKFFWTILGILWCKVILDCHIALWSCYLCEPYCCYGIESTMVYRFCSMNYTCSHSKFFQGFWMLVSSSYPFCPKNKYLLASTLMANHVCFLSQKKTLRLHVVLVLG